MLKETLAEGSPAEYSFTGRVTSPKEIVVEAIARAGIRATNLRGSDLGTQWGKPRGLSATFSAHTASPPPPSRTPAGPRASSRHASIAPRTTSVHGLLFWDAL